MVRVRVLRTIFLVLGIMMVTNSILMLVSSGTWFTLLPAALEDTGPLNRHFVHDVGLAYFTFGIGILWCSRHLKQSSPIFLGVTIFTVGHAISHIGEILYGQLPITHWYIDFPLVFLPAIVLGMIALPAVWNYFQKA